MFVLQVFYCILYLTYKSASQAGRKEEREAKGREKGECSDPRQAWLPAQSEGVCAYAFLQMVGRGAPGSGLGSRNRTEEWRLVCPCLRRPLPQASTVETRKVELQSHMYCPRDFSHSLRLPWVSGFSPGK